MSLRRIIPGWLSRTYREQQRLAQAYKSVWETDSGRRVLNDIIRQSGVFAPTGTGDDAAFDAGRRAVGLHALEKISLNNETLMALSDAAFEEEAETRERMKQ